MHPLILEAGLVAGLLLGLTSAMSPATAATPAATRSATPACPPPQAAVAEAFFSADCADCWGAPAGPAIRAPTTNTWRFDWISPGGRDAPLAAGALPEAAERAQRLGLAPATSPKPARWQTASKPLPGLRLRVESGPAWQGYFGVQLSLAVASRNSLPTGATAWLALVERVPAGSDGTPIPRALVRSMAGPLPLDALKSGKAMTTMTHLRALRWPASAEPTRLQARAWIEAPDGRLLAVVADSCPVR